MIAIVSQQTPKAINILAVICEYADLSLDALQGKSKTQEIAMFRQLFCYFALNKTDLALSAIGKIIKRDHSTVLHARAKTEGYIFVKDDIVMPAFTYLSNIFDVN